ncbi:MAG: hypothetical protein JO022_17560 [Acidobacteriaceae bacterium]|nr:hypothetical protein [Acidobacteriaceae bacterium]
MKTLILLIAATAASLVAQDASNRVTVPFSDPNRPRTVRAHMINGCVTVEGYDGKDVIIEPRAGGDSEERPRHTPRGAEGLKRIEPQGLGLNVEEENNVITIHGSPSRSNNLLVRVPVNTSVKLECMNGGAITVNRVTGDLELQNLNGAVEANNVSGTVIAHSLNGEVHISMDRVTPDKPMSFSSMNGNIDVSLPAGTRGNIHMKSDNGDVYSDFDVKLGGASSPVVEDGRSKGGKYKIKIDRTTNGTINGGGPDLTFKTFNGNIYIRQKK